MDEEMSSCLETIQTKANETLKSLMSIWKDLGVFGEAKESRLKSVEFHALRLFQAMLDEEEVNKLHLIKRIERYMKDIFEIRKELYGEASTLHEANMHDVPLYEVEKLLLRKWEDLKKIRDARIEQLEDLQLRYEDAQRFLGHSPIETYPGGLTELEVEAFKCRVLRLEEQRASLKATFESTKSAIQQIFDELEMVPSYPFDAKVLSTPSDCFILSADNMTALKKLHQSMEQKLSDAKDQATELRERLSNLWERLQISADHREKFLDEHRGYSYPTIAALKQELQACEQIKRANIELFVRKLREELVSWWDKCHIAQNQRDQFHAFRYTAVNEDVLDLHELEVNKFKEYYESNRDIFQLVEERSQLWEKVFELEERAKDPNRFNNRGGQLLKEEQERKRLAKKLPKVEQELQELLLAFEQKHGTPFLMDGEILIEKIDKEIEERNGLKEMQKQQKKETRSHQLEVESKLGTHSVTPTFKRGRPVSTTPSILLNGRTLTVPKSAPPKTMSTALKRKAEDSSHINVSKRSKGTRKSQEKKSSRSGNKSGPRLSTSKIRRFGKAASRALDIPASKARRNILPLPSDNLSTVSGIGPYSEFQSQLEMMSSEKVCRSSVVPSTCLKEVNAPAVTPSDVSSTTKLTLTPGRVATSTHLSAKKGSSVLSVTPMKPPRRIGCSATPTPVRRTSTRLNLKSPGVRSPASTTNARLTTPRSRLPIVF